MELVLLRMIVSAPRLPSITEPVMEAGTINTGDVVSALAAINGGFGDAASDIDGVVTTVGLDHRAGGQIASQRDGVSTVSGGIEQEAAATKNGCSL